jgi:hypothetical protein
MTLAKRLTCACIVLLLSCVPASPLTAENSPPLAFGYQLRSSSIDDSVAVVFAVSVMNVSAAPYEVCGVFYFNCVFKPVPDIPRRDRTCPVFGVLDGKLGASLRCQSTIMMPGQTLSDTLKFRYSPDYFKPCTGQIEIDAEFVYGESGTLLNDAKRAGKDWLRVCIPVNK